MAGTTCLAQQPATGRRSQPPQTQLHQRRQQQPWRPAARLQVEACHRCLAAAAARPLPLLSVHGSGGARGLRSVAAVKSGLEDAQQGGAAAEGESLQSPKAQGQQQAVGQPRGERQQQQPEEQQESAGVQAALAMLRFYKSAISPLLPPACRFVPTCSVYAMDAFQKYGVSKGFVLTAWRLLRCAPWGNRGYDPVRWPPPGLEPLFGGSSSGKDGGGQA